MTRQLCLGQLDQPPKKRGRAAAKGPAKGPWAEPGRHTFTILERVPVHSPAHAGVWALLRKHATRQLITDAEHAEEAFPAHVIMIDQLGGDAIGSIVEVLAERRATALAAEKGAPGEDVHAKRLDRIFEQELEWLSMRNHLAGALPRASNRKAAPRRGRKRARALLLIDA